MVSTQKQCVIFCVLAVLCASHRSHAVILGPYGAATPGTTHLWHMDESQGSGTFTAIDAVVGPGNYNLSPFYTANASTSSTNAPRGPGPLNSHPIGLGAASFRATFGTALNNTDTDTVNEPATTPVGFDPNSTAGLTGLNLNDVYGNGSNVPFSRTRDTGAYTGEQMVAPSTLFGPDGAFTWEAVVRVGWDPTVNYASAVQSPANTDTRYRVSDNQMSIIGADNEPGSNRLRIGNFSIDPAVGPGGEATLNAYSIAGGPSVTAYLPTSGDNALVQGGWYHVAVSYNGKENTAGNVTLYWTRLDGWANVAAEPIIANAVGTGVFTADWPTGTGNIADLSIGNSSRTSTASSFPTVGWIGSFDEVRMSNVARGPNEFIFGVPEPSSIALAAIAALTCSTEMWRRRMRRIQRRRKQRQ